MEISPSFVPGLSSANAPAGPRQTEDAAAFSAVTAAPTGRSRTDEIVSKYDFSNISPREIDQLAKELNEAGEELPQGFLLLLTRGEEFQRHLAELGAKLFGGTPQYADYTQKIDLVAQTKEQYSFARSHGEPTQGYEDLLALFDRYDARPAAFTPGAPSAYAETLARAQFA